MCVCRMEGQGEGNLCYYFSITFSLACCAKRKLTRVHLNPLIMVSYSTCTSKNRSALFFKFTGKNEVFGFLFF